MLNGLLVTFGEVMKTIGGIALAIVILLAMVTIHEFGHYIAGKILGFKINEFAVGFGPAIFKKRSKKTGELFALRVIPLGGYCAFDGEDELEEEKDGKEADKEEPFEEMHSASEKEEKDGDRVEIKEEKEEYPQPQGARFNDQKPWKRIIVLIAGAAMNYLLALVLLFILFGCFGCIHSYVVYAGEETTPPVLSETVLNHRDVVLSVDGKDIYMTSDYVDALSGKKAGEKVELAVLRQGEEITLTLTLQADCDFKSMTEIGKVYRALGMDTTQCQFVSVTVKEGFWETIGSSFVYSFKIGGTVLRSLGELITGRVGIDAVGGPITTISVTAQAASSGIRSFLNIGAFIGVNLAVFNLLPVPALDGSKVIFCIIEWIRKKPVNRKVETIIHFVGIIALFAFAILVDVIQLFLLK